MAIDLIALATHPVVLAALSAVAITAAVVFAVTWATSTNGDEADQALAPEAEPDQRYVTRTNRDGNTYDI